MNNPRITIRPAQPADVPALTAIKGPGSEAVHLDRLRDAQTPDTQYLVLLDGTEVAGFASLIFRRPAHWSDAADTTRLPQIVDLQVAESRRGQGLGSVFIRALEGMAASRGCKELFLAVDPLDNPRAQALYLRLGYQPLQAAPYRAEWHFTDSAGIYHHGEEWAIDMLKPIGAAQALHDPRRLDALRILHDRLEDPALPALDWALTGSTALALQGVDVVAHDIDLQTNAEDAYRAEERLQEFVVTPVREAISQHIRSHLGKLEMHGIQVEIMGDIQKRAADGPWDEPPRLEQNKLWIEFEGLRLPVLALEYEYRAYLQMGRLEKAERIRRRLER